MTCAAPVRLSTVTMGSHRGSPRVYLQGKWLLRAAFAPGAAIQATFTQGKVVLLLAPAGDRRVSAKAAGRVPVIDINSDALRDALGSTGELQVKATAGEITITPARTAAKVAARVRNGLEGSVFSGGGLLTEAARQAGYAPAFAVEIDPAYAEIYEANHPTAQVFCMSVHEVPTDQLPQVELLTIGIPCEPFSVKRRATKPQLQLGMLGDEPSVDDSDKGRQLPPEAHPHGDMVVWALRLIDACNPYTVVTEEVPRFLDSGAGWIYQHALRRMGYTVDARVLDSTDYDGLTMRKRAVIVATTDPVVHWPAPQPPTRRLGAILDSDVPDSSWFDATSKPWLFKHWVDQGAKGNNFGNQRFTADSPHTGAISRRYFNGVGDAPVLRHPTLADTYRWFTLAEVKRLHGLPDSYWLPEAKTAAGLVLGQGVVVSTFRLVIAAQRGN